MLTSQGWEELKQMAIRYKNWYPELLDVPYSEKHFEVGILNDYIILLCFILEVCSISNSCHCTK